eukprot:TRINITY_DN24204_c0_g2_i1.p4 TRINITY_DN24204_c0_g2~~TRINITY_DN24204_c0_g2_i1.p4  ORF type:complete len:103 (+),score=5.41 TRINITY_DN24204_c0_g2_i1:35-310(+)
MMVIVFALQVGCNWGKIREYVSIRVARVILCFNNGYACTFDIVMLYWQRERRLVGWFLFVNTLLLFIGVLWEQIVALVGYTNQQILVSVLY